MTLIMKDMRVRRRIKPIKYTIHLLKNCETHYAIRTQISPTAPMTATPLILAYQDLTQMRELGLQHCNIVKYK